MTGPIEEAMRGEGGPEDTCYNSLHLVGYHPEIGFEIAEAIRSGEIPPDEAAQMPNPAAWTVLTCRWCGGVLGVNPEEVVGRIEHWLALWEREGLNQDQMRARISGNINVLSHIDALNLLTEAGALDPARTIELAKRIPGADDYQESDCVGYLHRVGIDGEPPKFGPQIPETWLPFACEVCDETVSLNPVDVRNRFTMFMDHFRDQGWSDEAVAWTMVFNPVNSATWQALAQLHRVGALERDEFAGMLKRMPTLEMQLLVGMDEDELQAVQSRLRAEFPAGSGEDQ